MIIQLVGVFGYLVWFPQYAQLIYPSLKLLMVGLPLVWLLYGISPVRPSGRQRVTAGIVSGLLIVIVLLGVALLLKDLLLTFRPLIQQTVERVGIGSYYLLFALFLSLVHSLFEELYWRWFVYGMLRHRFSFLAAAGVSSVAFASHHYVVLGQFLSPALVILGGTIVGMAGFFWCYLYEKTNSIVASWVSHIFADAAVMLIGYWLIF